MSYTYQRRNVDKAVVLALRTLGGSASRKNIRKEIANGGYDGLKYQDVFGSKTPPSGKKYNPFMFDFNFGIQNLTHIGYVEKPIRNGDIVLTDLGRNDDLKDFPTPEQQDMMDAYWNKKDEERKIKNQLAKAEQSESKSIEDTDDTISADSSDKEDTAETTWKTELINQLMQFDPGKFESFSRLLISKMGVTIDKKRGIIRSGDHGIDGFGYFTSDEFRTSRVAIQCKRYTKGSVSEPEIDKFKGAMDSFNAEYGIFVTTSSFTDKAKMKATQGTNTVTLINGQDLADLVEKYQLHITPVTTYALDDYYY